MSTGIAGALEDLRRNTARNLKDLRRNWGSAYQITGDPGVWRAVRRDSQVTLTAAGPGKLRDLITADYTARPVPRSCPCPEIRPGVTEWSGPLPPPAAPAPAIVPGLADPPTPRALGDRAASSPTVAASSPDWTASSPGQPWSRPLAGPGAYADRPCPRRSGRQLVAVSWRLLRPSARSVRCGRSGRLRRFGRRR